MIQHLLRRMFRQLLRWLSHGRRRAQGSSDPRAASLARPVQPGLPAPPLESRACVSVVIPALNEAARIAYVVQHALADPATAEVIVVDDSSIDDTARLAGDAGARVITSSMLGKGASMRDGAQAARHELVVYLDGDLSGLRPHIITDLCRPLLAQQADFVKARFGRTGGRVTELTAKPMLKVFFPELAALAQPLGGLIAARRSLLLNLAFEDGYGVDIGLLIDALRAGARLTEVDIGSLEHDSQPLLDLTAMANEISRVIYQRARLAGRLHMEQIAAMYETQRQATATLDYIATRRRGRSRLLLLDMDGTLTPARYVTELARATGHSTELDTLLDSQDDAVTRSTRIAELFRFVHRQQFERVAQHLPLRPGVIECVNVLRRQGFMVGVVSDSYFVAAEVVRRRIFADFALAHTLQFDSEVCTGQLHLNPAFTPLVPGQGAPVCKSHVLGRFRQADGQPPIDCIWAVGDHLNDLAMLQSADRAFVIDPKHPSLTQLSGAHAISSFDELTQQAIDDLAPRAAA